MILNRRLSNQTEIDHLFKQFPNLKYLRLNLPFHDLLAINCLKALFSFHEQFKLINLAIEFHPQQCNFILSESYLFPQL